ncbi:hypothetical protein FNF31_05606 [Cafeteria roenbergensis]|nr:hypothetical protein FNF31_05606 [Cafeteria roenbergensis]
MGTSWACEADWHLCNEDGEGLAKEYYAASSKTRSSAQMLMCHIYTDLQVTAPDVQSARDGFFSRLDDEISSRMDAERRKHVHCTYGNLLNYKTLAQSAAYIGAEVALDQASALASPVVGELAKDAGQHLRGSALLQATSRGWPSRLSMPFRGQKHREQALLDSEGGPASDDGFERQETMNPLNSLFEDDRQETENPLNAAIRSGVATPATSKVVEQINPLMEHIEVPRGELILRPSDIMLPPGPESSGLNRGKAATVALMATNAAISYGLNSLFPFLTYSIRLFSFIVAQGVDKALDPEFRQCLACHALSPPQVLYDIFHNGELPKVFCGLDTTPFLNKADEEYLPRLPEGMRFDATNPEGALKAVEGSDNAFDQAFSQAAAEEDLASQELQKQVHDLTHEVQDEINKNMLAGMMRQIILGFILSNKKKARALMAARRVADGKFAESALDTYMANTNDLMKEVFKDQFGKADRFWHAIVRGLTIGQDKLLLTLSTNLGSSLERRRRGFRKGLAFVTINRFLRALDQAESQEAKQAPEMLANLQSLRLLPPQVLRVAGQLPMFTFCQKLEDTKNPLFEIATRGFLETIEPGLLGLPQNSELELVTNAREAFQQRVPYLVNMAVDDDTARGRHLAAVASEESTGHRTIFGRHELLSDHVPVVSHESLSLGEAIRAYGSDEDAEKFAKACELTQGSFFSTRKRVGKSMEDRGQLNAESSDVREVLTARDSEDDSSYDESEE